MRMCWVGVFAIALASAACGDEQVQSPDGGGAAVPDGGDGRPSLGDRIERICELAGEPCDFEGWCQPTDCNEWALCWCSGGVVTCDSLHFARGDTCELPPNAGCELEGTGVCDDEPVGGGGCACVDGTWSCTNTCDGCPDQEPASGAPCDTVGASCLYSSGNRCDCTPADGFQCSSL